MLPIKATNYTLKKMYQRDSNEIDPNHEPVIEYKTHPLITPMDPNQR